MKSHNRALRALVERYGLLETQERQLAALLSGLEADEHAPTTVTEPASALNVHVADSLVALELGVVRERRSIADIGSGTGFPGIAIAVASPESEVALVESQSRKCAFIDRLCEAAEVGNAAVVRSRAEEWRAGAGANDVVLARALAPAPVVLEYAAPLLKLGGTLVEWRGRRDADDEAAAAAAAAQLGMRLVNIRHVHPFEGALDRHLHVWVKEAETPERFPRRAGMARKRPLA